MSVREERKMRGEGGWLGGETVSAADNIMNAAEETSCLGPFLFCVACKSVSNNWARQEGVREGRGERGVLMKSMRVASTSAYVCLSVAHKTNEPST